MRRSALLAALAGCAHTPAPPRAAATLAEATPRARTVDYAHLDAEAAIAHARAHGPIAAERAELEAIARARIGAARQLADPEVRLGRSFDDSALDEPARTSVALRLHPDRPWEVDARLAQARSGVRAERATSEAAERAVAARIRRAYARLALAEVTARLLDRELGVLGERERVLAEQLGHATATRLEKALADQDLAEVAAARSAIDVAQLEHRAEIAALAGIPAAQPWTPALDAEVARLTAVRTGLDREALVARAVASHPELAAAAARAEVAAAAAREESGRRVPWLETLQVERSERTEVAWAVSATVTLPLFGLTGGRLAVARAAQALVDAARTRLAGQTARDVAASVALVETTGARSAALRDQLAATSAAIEVLLAQERGASSSDPVKVLLLEERHLRAQRAVLDAALAHRTALIALEELVGAPP
ncbi:MAG: hypothetical protein KF773_10465 [Deltaproteobacteria bacterium]|nr:hypothetical protein [Deltaproteobacteria bacterium]